MRNLELVEQITRFTRNSQLLIDVVPKFSLLYCLIPTPANDQIELTSGTFEVKSITVQKTMQISELYDSEDYFNLLMTEISQEWVEALGEVVRIHKFYVYKKMPSLIIDGDGKVTITFNLFEVPKELFYNLKHRK